MRSFLLLTGLSLLCACPSKAPVSPAGEDAGDSALPGDQRPPGRVEHPPTGQGLPDELKPPGH